MKEIDYEKQLKALLKANGYTGVSVGRYDRLTGREGICIRKLPATRTVEYMDGDIEMQRVVQVIVRRRVADVAIEECDWLADLVDGATVESANGSYEFVAQEVYTEPEEFMRGEDGFSAWAFRLRATLMIER